MATGFTILSLLSAGSGVPDHAARLIERETPIKWRKVVTALRHFIRLKTSMFSVYKGLNGKMDKIAKTLLRGVYRRVDITISSGTGHGEVSRRAPTLRAHARDGRAA